MRRFLALAILMAPTTLHAQIVSGSATAIDGDSLSLGDTQIRLHGIDAVEGAQTCQRAGATWNCGEEAAGRLRQLVNGNQVTCTGRDTDKYGRLVATCMVGRTDLSDTMVRSGLAVALPQFSDAYLDAEERARTNRIGIWASEFEAPSVYRAAHPRTDSISPHIAQRSSAPARRQSYSSKNCDIKGNHRLRGEWIYHLPGMPYYDATRAEEIFCSEEQAQAAGYRRALVRQ